LRLLRVSCDSSSSARSCALISASSAGMRPDLLYLRALSCFLSAADASLNDWPSSPVVMSAAMRRSSSALASTVRLLWRMNALRS